MSGDKYKSMRRQVYKAIMFAMKDVLETGEKRHAVSHLDDRNTLTLDFTVTRETRH